MKKITSIILILALTLLTLSSCSFFGEKKLRIGYMSGPTGMGMAKLIHDNGGVDGNDKSSFTSYTDTSLAKADLTAGNT